MPGDVVTVTSGKGGVGKTTTAVNVAVALRQHGHSVVVLDADLGMPNVEGFFDLDAERSVHDVLAGEADLDEAVVELTEGLAVLAGDRSLDGFAAADPAELDDVVDALAERYRYVVVDTGGGLSYEGLLPLELGDAAVLVTSPDPASVGDTEKSKQLADRFDVPVRGVVVTHATAGTDAEGIADRLGVDLLGTIPQETAVAESTSEGTPVVAYAPDSRAAVTYTRIGGALSADAEPTLEPLDSQARAPGDPVPDFDDPEEDAADVTAGRGSQRGSAPATDGGPGSASAAADEASDADAGDEDTTDETEDADAEGDAADDATPEESAETEGSEGGDGAGESEEGEDEEAAEESGGVFSRLSGLFG